MLPIVSRILGTAVSDFKRDLVTAKRSVDVFQKYSLEALEFGAAITAAKAAFINSPSDKTFKAWLALETSRDAAARLGQDISSEVTGRREQAVKEVGRSKLLAAVAEVAAGLNAREAELRADDAKRSEELGVTMVSTEAYEALDKVRERLDQAKSWSVVDFSNAVSALRGVIGEEGA